MDIQWESTGKKKSIEYECGYCGNRIASEVGWSALVQKTSNPTLFGDVRICHLCFQPTFFRMMGTSLQVPSPIPGTDVLHLPGDVKALYDEARHCFGVNVYTAAVLALRKLLMHVAVEKGAAENLKFVEYVEYLDKKGHLGHRGQGLGRRDPDEGQ